MMDKSKNNQEHLSQYADAQTWILLNKPTKQ
jgi:hypothetical protein